MKFLGKRLWNKRFYKPCRCGICLKSIIDNDIICVTYFMREEYHISYQTLYCRSCYDRKYDGDL